MSASAIVQISYFAAAVLFIVGLKSMSSPVTARRGIIWAGVGMVVATVATFLTPGMGNFALMIAAIAIGGGVAWWSGKIVKMTDMPQMVAIYNGMGGGAAAAIAAVEFVRHEAHGELTIALAVLGALIGAVSFSGSCIAFAKLQGLMKKAYRLPGQNIWNIALAGATLVVGLSMVLLSDKMTGVQILSFFILSLVLGVVITMPIGGADMPVVISLFNAFTGLAVGFEGYVLGNPALIIAGIVVGAAGTLLTQLMAKAMNRPITNIIFQPLSGEAQAGGATVEGSMKEVGALDAAAMMRYGSKVIIVPGYGMAVAGAQHKVWEMAQLLEKAGVEVKFAIHPVAGRMPGHMNVLLAEAGVPYDKIFDLEEINAEFPLADVALVIGANDVVNPSARTDKSSPIYGMPILDADKAQNVIVIKRGKGAGYSGIENALFYAENCRLLYGSAQQVAGEVVGHIKAMGD
ncbi:NAD(P)(+) transhydrogenase (Re/Si-specific) subunit beta [Uliginosibacterium sp. H1]|uniref:NAD(P)(+) transhydrogenase (Re/Si-specific) subunit beta n=1 Tax=Uliginosibacterium sp. H1 TaxID=3114757 RepID=UPI002E177E98|nr:NAD(P)(+) transhydrogenase (Re/Si-specific) subunit beta [Uliginosibacterium sp. H1]